MLSIKFFHGVDQHTLNAFAIRDPPANFWMTLMINVVAALPQLGKAIWMTLYRCYMDV